MSLRSGILVALGGAVLLALLVPRFDATQPWGLALTHAMAEEIADRKARELGIDVDAAWRTVTWSGSLLLEDTLAREPARRRAAATDPVLGPRLGGYLVTYFRRGLEKFPAFGKVTVGTGGEVVAAARTARSEEPGARPSIEELRPRADAFVAARSFPGAPSPVFESARPDVLLNRTDHVFRYTVASPAAPAGIRLLLLVHFTGAEVSGFGLADEYDDGRSFRYELAGSLAVFFVRYGMLIFLPFGLAAAFLKKYHAGEVGVAAGALLFAVMLVASVVAAWSTAAPAAYGASLGGTEARLTALVWAAMMFLFKDLPLAVVVFTAWAVGESYARERWGERLAAFDALLRRDLVNATVGRSLLTGILAGPAVAAATLLPAAVATASGRAWLTPTSELFGAGSVALVSALGPATLWAYALLSALLVTVVAVLFGLAALRRSGTAAGLAAACLLGTGLSYGAPITPPAWQLATAFGAPVAAALVFLSSDLLAAFVSLFGASLLVELLPLARSTAGPVRVGALVALVAPVLFLAIVGAAGIATRRTIAYRYDDLAPHVRRIVERERVKAEIDAANRIQAALLPPSDPALPGAAVASHYRAATEIGGDYFDFLQLPGGRTAIAFGDVAGHGLTSGIVMAMAKAALLVQVSHDASPPRVLEVLNDVVRRTAPGRITMTFFFGVLDPFTGELRFSSAGHLDPFVVRDEGGRLEALSAWGFPLGVRRRDPFREQVVTLVRGDRLVLYSDGLIEAADDDGEPFGFDRFEQALRASASGSIEEIRGALLAAVTSYTRNRPPEDDQTLVVLRFAGTAPLQVPAPGV